MLLPLGTPLGCEVGNDQVTTRSSSTCLTHGRSMMETHHSHASFLMPATFTSTTGVRGVAVGMSDPCLRSPGRGV